MRQAIATSLLACLCMAACIVFVTLYVHAEHPAYVWDFSGYWNQYKNTGRHFLEDWRDALRQTQLLIASQDYNPSSILPLLPIYWLFGGDRAPYVAGIAVIYLVPVAFVAARLARADAGPQARLSLLTLFVAFSYPAFWRPTLRGMVDVAGLLPLGLAALILFRTDYLTKANWKTALGFGLLLWSAFLLRRWYAFSLVALVMTALLFLFATALSNRRPLAPVLRAAIPNYAVAGVTALVALACFQPHLLTRILTTSYSDSYSAYQADLAGHLKIYYDHLGLWLLALAATGLVADLLRKRMRSAFGACVAILTMTLFSRIQAPGLQHSLPVELFLFPAYASGLLFLAQRLPAPRLAAPALGVLVSLNFLSTFAPFGWGAGEPARLLFPQARYGPLRLAQYDEYLRLISDLKALEPGATVAIFASSFTMSDSLLAALDPAVARRLEDVAHVDRRDGFDWMALAADYALIGEPTPLHLKAGSQKVIEFPAQDIAAGEGIGAAFVDSRRRYRLDDGVTARLYKRLRAVSAEEIGHLANRFYAVYPDWKRQKATVRFGLASARIATGEATGQVWSPNPDLMLVRPGLTQPTTVTFRMDEWFRPRRVMVSALNTSRLPCKNDESLVIEIGSPGAEPSSLVAAGERSASMDIPDSDQFTIAVAPATEASCGIAIFTFTFADGGR